MATRSRTSFQKRQKEIARMEKQRDKAAKRQQRKLEKQTHGSQDGADIEYDGMDLDAGDGADLAETETTTVDKE